MNEIKVVHIDTQDTWRGGQRQVIELIRRLTGRGVTNILACKPASEISRKAVELGIPVIHYPFHGEWDIVSAMKLRAYIKREKIQIVHVHSSHAHMIAIIALHKLRMCRLIVSRRVDFHIRSFFSRKYKYGAGVDKIIAVSDAIKRVLIEDGINPASIVTIRSGFVIENFAENSMTRDIRLELGIPRDATVIATVAALAPHKAHYTLIKAAYHVVKKYPDVIFLIAGEGEMRSQIERDIRSLDLQNSVKLLGFVDEVGAVYQAADIFAISSREEGLCSSLFDAMYFNLPIVATSAGGIPEIVMDNVNGFIVPVDDYISFANRLNYLIENVDERKKMGARSTMILKNNTIDQTVDTTLDVYREVLVKS